MQPEVMLRLQDAEGVRISPLPRRAFSFQQTECKSRITISTIRGSVSCVCVCVVYVQFHRHLLSVCAVSVYTTLQETRYVVENVCVPLPSPLNPKP